MVEKRFARAGSVAMSMLALAVALFSWRFAAVLWGFWPAIDPKLHGLIQAHPIETLGHMLVAPVALLLGPWQFMARLRARQPRLHRWSGRVYVTACVVAGIAGLSTALHATGGPIAGFGFGLLAVLWVGTTIGAWRAALAHHIALHRLLMRFSYAMTFGAVTLRLQIPIGLALGFPNYTAMSVWLAYTSWIPNVILVALWSWGRRPRMVAELASA